MSGRGQVTLGGVQIITGISFYGHNLAIVQITVRQLRCSAGNIRHALYAANGEKAPAP